MQLENAKLPKISKSSNNRDSANSKDSWPRHILLLGGSLIMLFPLGWMIKMSLSTAAIARRGEILGGFGGSGLQPSNYAEALHRMMFLDALANTTLVTSFSVVGSVFSSSLVGFGLAKFNFYGRRTIFLLVLGTMMLPAQVTLVPVFLGWREFGAINTFWPLIIPSWFSAPFFVFMFRQFFSQIPDELLDAARIDGAGTWRVYWQILLPLSKPVVAITAAYAFIGSWNDYLGPLIFLDDADNYTLSLALNGFKGQYGVKEIQLLMAATCACLLPCVVVFLASQRYLMSIGATSGLKT